MLSWSPYQGLTGQSCRHPDHDSKEQFNCAVSENRDRPKISILHSSQVSHFPCNPYSQSGGILTAQPLTLFLVINMYVCLWIYSNHFIQNKVGLLGFFFFRWFFSYTIMIFLVINTVSIIHLYLSFEAHHCPNAVQQNDSQMIFYHHIPVENKSLHIIKPVP